MHPERVGELLRKMAKVDDVNTEQTEQDQRLPPLRGVAPKHAHILDEHGTHIAAHLAQHGSTPQAH